MSIRTFRRLRFQTGMGILLLYFSALAAPAPAFQSVLQKLEVQHPLDAASALGSYPELESAPSGTMEPTAELTLAQAVALALRRNPSLAEFAWQVRAQEARVLQAGLLPNPSLSTVVENLGTSRDDITGGVQTTIQLGQLVELGGKRSARKRLADLGLDLTEFDYEIVRLDLLHRVSRSFVGVLAAQKRVALAEETVQLAVQIAAAVAGRVEAGKASPVEATKTNVALATARIGFDRAKRELDSSRRFLSTTWGNAEPLFETAVGEFDTFFAVPDLQRMTMLLGENPLLSLSAGEVAFRQAEVDLARASRVPDLTVRAGAIRYKAFGEDTDALLVGFSVRLPFFDRKQGEVVAARSEVEGATQKRRATEVRLRTALTSSYQLLASAHSEVATLRDTVLPGALSAFEAVNEGYRLGRFGLLDVLDSQRTLFEARRQYLQVAEDYHKAVADLERLIGARLDPAEPTPDGDSQ